jgi:hypothetical protein
MKKIEEKTEFENQVEQGILDIKSPSLRNRNISISKLEV